MRVAAAVLAGFLIVSAAPGQSAGGPTDAKAKKTFADAEQWVRRGELDVAIDTFRKANKQDGGHCGACASRIIQYGLKIGDFRDADEAAEQMIADAPDAVHRAAAHLDRATVQYREGVQKRKPEYYAAADEEFRAVLAEYPNVPRACFGEGLCLAQMKRDGEAQERFRHFLEIAPKDDVDRVRAQRYIEHPDLVRAQMAPPFAIRTLDGREVSLDGLAGKVVLLDFWATWCGPCRAALPHIRELATKFSAEPLVVMSISLDSDEAKWKDFIAKNGMTWLQYRDSSGQLQKLFNVTAIPQTFTIDANGVLQDQHIGDAEIEGKLRKLCAQARQREEAPDVAQKSGSE